MLIYLAITLYTILSACVLAKASTRVPRLGPLTGRCGQCRYSLKGLGLETVCPECGSGAREREPRGTELVIDPTVRSGWWLTLVGFVLGCLVYWPAAWLFVYPAYVAEGFDTEQAMRVIPNRELASPGTMFVLMSPYLICLTISPLVLLIRRPRLARRIIVTLWGLGFLAGLAASLLCPAAQQGPH